MQREHSENADNVEPAPPPGFQGLREDLPVHCYVRRLPHWRQDGATYFVTFRLADSLPQSKLNELARLRSALEQRNPEQNPTDEATAHEIEERIEHWLDQDFGACSLKEITCARIVAESMLHFDNKRYELGCYVVMPNHVHVIARPLLPQQHPLEDIVKSWKSYSGRRVNETLRRKGELWQEEAFDRIVRDEEQLWKTLQYIQRNAIQASISEQSKMLWLRPDWVSLGWRFCE